jgi:hypothetical protein
MLSSVKVLVGMALVVSLCACSSKPDERIVDDSWQNIPAAHVKELVDLVADRSFDPMSVHIRKLRLSSNKIPPPRAIYCGDVNMKARAGGYTGFAPFSVEFDGNKKVTFIFDEQRSSASKEFLEAVGCISTRGNAG